MSAVNLVAPDPSYVSSRLTWLPGSARDKLLRAIRKKTLYKLQLKAYDLVGSHTDLGYEWCRFIVAARQRT